MKDKLLTIRVISCLDRSQETGNGEELQKTGEWASGRKNVERWVICPPFLFRVADRPVSEQRWVPGGSPTPNRQQTTLHVHHEFIRPLPIEAKYQLGRGVQRDELAFPRRRAGQGRRNGAQDRR